MLEWSFLNLKVLKKRKLHKLIIPYWNFFKRRHQKDSSRKTRPHPHFCTDPFRDSENLLVLRQKGRPPKQSEELRTDKKTSVRFKDKYPCPDI
ncbi:hypothetical protein CEXT_597731 [Caerostris extrusa]|uniref:Uncharacterized protein n=1 Tax=Caerostris extrusa TaxID=172846 RepID=A0AAV4YFE0_CAEEX|nr:hypothetical protein CEXT_597731 [Caerostris extrusa]